MQVAASSRPAQHWAKNLGLGEKVPKSKAREVLSNCKAIKSRNRAALMRASDLQCSAARSITYVHPEIGIPNRWVELVYEIPANPIRLITYSNVVTSTS